MNFHDNDFIFFKVIISNLWSIRMKHSVFETKQVVCHPLTYGKQGYRNRYLLGVRGRGRLKKFSNYSKVIFNSNNMCNIHTIIWFQLILMLIWISMRERAIVISFSCIRIKCYFKRKFAIFPWCVALMAMIKNFV